LKFFKKMRASPVEPALFIWRQRLDHVDSIHVHDRIDAPRRGCRACLWGTELSIADAALYSSACGGLS
jgi:hypothetical protein